MKRRDRMKEEFREWVRVVEERNGRIRDMVRKELEEALEKRECREREMKR